MKYIMLAVLFFNVELLASKKCYYDWMGDKVCKEESASGAFGNLLAFMIMSEQKEAQANIKKLKGVLVLPKTPKNNNWSYGLISSAPSGE